MGRGVYIEVTHREGCGLKNATASARRVPVAGNGRRMCKCSPRVRAQVKRRWVAEGVFPEGWTQANLRQFEAEAVGAREAHESGRRTIERDRVPTFGELAADYLARLERRRELDEVAAQTVRQRRTGVRRLEARGWTGKPVTAITREAVDELRAELRGEGYAMNTISGTYVATIAVILNESDAIGRWLPTSPTSQRWARRSPRTLVRPERTPRSLDIDFVFALLDEAAKRDDGLLLHDMILTGVTTGMRKREIAGLLRHTFATTLDAGRCRPLAIDAVMGHKNQGVSFRYRHVLAPDLDEMVRVLNEQFNRTPPDVVRLDDRRRKAA
jgi:integrase